ncbi:pyridoxamine 5'-phosphate oxidase [Solirhodobacter olei]|uniref:pyridoxamine 5'-phosphate oxidase n=1 Tax=Solirhodobacter olei TaxID=2493082 RepID=UPI000FD78945|nr:pyridoxamine 5'-phosphate oxidase [Solirhodobacter olei]
MADTGATAGEVLRDAADRGGIFAGSDPFTIARAWLAEAEASEPNDPNAIALATVDADGLPNVRMVLLKEIEADAFVFYTNYGSAKAQEVDGAGKAAFVMHWKSLRRQIRVRGLVEREEGPQADAYYASRSLKSRLGAWASDQSKPLASRAALMADVARITALKGPSPPRPPFWGGYRIRPLELEFWADGAFRLHDRFRWRRNGLADGWEISRLNP